MVDVPPPQSALERQSISSLSRPQVVLAYANWTDVSAAEEMCLSAVAHPEANILDIGCGAGRHAHWLDGRFQTYVGVDASPPMIQQARRNFPDLDFRDVDILNYREDRPYLDVILMMGNVLDFLHPFARRHFLFERCREWLREGGRLVGSSHLTLCGQNKGYYEEDYHGAPIQQYRLSPSEMVDEVERHGFDVQLFTRDDRKSPALWAYWVARTRSCT